MILTFVSSFCLVSELLDEKDYLVERNEDLQIILSVETGETNLTQEIFHEGVQGIELSTLWTKTPKQLVKYVKVRCPNCGSAFG